MDKFVVKTNSIANYIFTFAKLNFYWIILSILGLGLFGVFPSTLALIKLYEKTDNSDVNISFRSYFEKYKEVFLRSNKVAVSIYIILILMNVNLEILNQNSSIFPIILPIVFISSNIIMLLISIWVIPILINYSFDLKSKLRISLILSISQLKTTLYFLLILVFVLLLSYYIPAFALFFASSVLSYIYYKIIYNKINDYTLKTYSIIKKG